jgi:hypothetical protein
MSEVGNEGAGRCARCRRVLKDKKSIAIGMGPKCAAKVKVWGRTPGISQEQPIEGQIQLENEGEELK